MANYIVKDLFLKAVGNLISVARSSRNVLQKKKKDTKGSIVQRMASTLSLLCCSSVAALVEESQQEIKIWEDTTGAQIKVMPFQYLREKPPRTWSRGEELHFQYHQDKYSNYWTEKQSKQQALAAFIAGFF